MQTVSQLNVLLSHLVPSRRNPRKVKPSREAHHCLVALIRSQGLLQPLVVRPMEDKPKHYIVIAGHRRLAALREIHREDDPKIPCVLRDVDMDTADALSLGENFGQQAMHPLDQAEAFSRLATQDGKDVLAIAAEFGVTEHYVRQRMKLAGLAAVIKAAYRVSEIDTATAEAFSAVPDDRQIVIWQETNGHPRHAEHVRNIIAYAWIDAAHARFDLSTLPESAVSRDLFSERVLIERQAFMTAQIDALAAERAKLVEEGWSNAIAGRYEDVHAQATTLDIPDREFDEQTTAKLEKLAARYQRWEAKLQEIPDDDETALHRVQAKLEALNAEEREIVEHAPAFCSEGTKAIGTAFLMLLPDGSVRQEFRVPRRRKQGSNGHTNGNSPGGVEDEGSTDRPQPPTSDDLKDSQLATTFTHQALAVREALLQNGRARQRVLALILHEKVRSEALSVQHEANGTTLHASQGESFTSAAFDRLQKQRVKLDPFSDAYSVKDVDAYARLSEFSASKFESLVDLLIVACITAHMQRKTELVHLLAVELKVNIRDHWRPDAVWLAGYQKIQLAGLMAELRGPVYSVAHETRKKSELVEALATLFADAAEGKLEDKQLAERINGWTPANLREELIKQAA